MPPNHDEVTVLTSAAPSSASVNVSRPPHSAEAGPAMAWIALGFGIWVTAGVMLVFWALDQGLADHPLASIYHAPIYLALVALAVFSVVQAVRALRAGRGWRRAFPPGYGLLGGSIVLAVAALVLELGWREGIGIAPGIEDNLAPTRVAISLALVLVAVVPLRAALVLPRGQVPRLAMLISAGLTLAIIGMVVRFHPAVNPWLERADESLSTPNELWVMDADGSNQTRLVEQLDPAISLGYASWSPDGRQIIYARFAIPDMDATRSDADIWAVSSDGTDAHEVVAGDGMQWIPRVSPDGAHVAYTQEEVGGPWANAGPVGPGPGAGPGGGAAVGPIAVPLANADLWQMTLDGSASPQRLTENAADDRAPVYSPDGSRVLFDSTRDGNTEIYVMDLATSQEVRLTDDAGEDWGATWSPDGTQIAFNSDRSGTMDVYVMAADGSGVRRITTAEHPWIGNLAPSWSPDGTRLAFTMRTEGEGSEVWSIAIDGSDPINLTRSAVTVDEAWTGGWGPHGRIVFGRTLPGPAEADLLVREDFGAAAMLLSAGLLAALVVAVVQAGWSFGAVTLVLGLAVAIVALPVEAWRFLPVGLAAGLVTDLAVSRASPRLQARVAGATAAAGMVLAFGIAVLATSGLGWSPTLLIGVAMAAGFIGWGIGALGNLDRRELAA